MYDCTELLQGRLLLLPLSLVFRCIDKWRVLPNETSRSHSNLYFEHWSLERLFLFQNVSPGCRLNGISG